MNSGNNFAEQKKLVTLICNNINKTHGVHLREFSLVGRDIAYYMQELEFEPRTPHFSTFNCMSSSSLT